MSNDESYDPDIDVTASAPLEPAADTSARARSQRRLIQARTAVSGAAARARNTAAFPTRRTDLIDEELGSDEPSTFSVLTDHVAAYRTYIAAAVLALLSLLALARKRRATAAPDAVDLGDWHLHAEPADQ